MSESQGAEAQQHNKIVIFESMKQINAIVLAALLLASVGFLTSKQAMGELSNVEIDVSTSANPQDYPFGIDCNDPDSAWLTLYLQGALVKIDKDSKSVSGIFDDPKGSIPIGQNFFGVAIDPATGNVFTADEKFGLAWRFNPNSVTWTSSPLVEELTTEGVSYPDGYVNDPTLIKFVTTSGNHTQDFNLESFGANIYANGFIWQALAYHADFPASVNSEIAPDLDFAGLAKIDPVTLEVSRFAIPDAIAPSGLALDPSESNILWLTDRIGKVYKFDLATETVVQTIVAGENSHNLAADSTYLYLPIGATSIFGDEKSLILRVEKANPENTLLIDTGAPNTEEGTFSVFLEGNVLTWTDLSGHVGTIDLATDSKEHFDTAFAKGNHFQCKVGNETWWAAKGSAHVGILANDVPPPEATEFDFKVTGKLKREGGSQTRNIEVTISGDYSCDENMRITPVSGSLSATIKDGSNTKVITQQSKIKFEQVDDFALKYNVNGGTFGKVSGKTTFGSQIDCHNEPDDAKQTKKNSMTFTKNSIKYKLQTSTDLARIEFN
jgi:hypothetical protein